MVLPPMLQQYVGVGLHDSDGCDDICVSHPFYRSDAKWLITIRKVDYHCGAGLDNVDIDCDTTRGAVKANSTALSGVQS